ncbi:MAG: protein translocase subunit SecD [Deltaproteobacteria bacterium]|nr:protein translocase subunit SecD [Candidatus Anaeroferrophillus wilburensis]MBN2889861.1 protein translocase subunit SecD [Deltaproteobacteria bacterium]
MIKSVKLRLLIILATIILAGVYLMPSVVSDLPDWWGKVLPTDKIHLGLDLQGGIHLLMEVDVEKALSASTDRVAGEMQRLLRDKKIDFEQVKQVDAGTLSIVLTHAGDSSVIKDLLGNEMPQWQMMSAEEQVVSYRVSSDERRRIEKLAIDQAVETMRNRIDQFGVSEPEIRPQADNRILVQLPGIKDTRRAIDLIGKTALLEFKLVSESFDPRNLESGTLPDHLEVLYQQEYDPVTKKVVRQVPFVLEKESLMTGEYIADAKVRFNSQFGEPYVAMDFNSQGAKLFDRITAENVKRRLAIILDNHVYSAPVIQERIAGGKAQISGRFSAKEARDLAIVLRAGALPAPIRILEKRAVGPSLGHDSIRKGLISMVVGGLLVVLFMFAFYRLSGLVANLALVLNMLFILSILALAKATLTLPGIAGIVLTIGMAVDANVLIFERIKEELRLGKTPRAALDSGYGKAFLTIMDANITTLIAAIVLYQYGTGPIKGFAVTLSVGIISSLFTAIFVTRLVYDFIQERKALKRLSI